MARVVTLLLAVGLVCAGGVGRQASAQEVVGRREVPFEPAGPWQQYASPADAGFARAPLRRARALADSVGSAAVMAVYRGRVVLAWGDVRRELEVHSVRKSLVSALYGSAVADGRVDLDATLGGLGIDDAVHPLTAEEKRATVRDVISARSGVYLPAAYAPDSQDEERPERGSHDPGTFWFYNNWDFNVAGVIYERQTGEDLYRSFADRIAKPIGMEDYTPADGFRVLEPRRSEHAAQTFRMSTRDLARFGLLMLHDGMWHGRRVLPEGWVDSSTARISEAIGGSGYGYMWWTFAPGDLPKDQYPVLGRFALFQARGSGGQGVWIIPALDLVVVHRGDTDHGSGVKGVDAWHIVEDIAKAEVEGGNAVSRPRLVALEEEPFSHPLPPPPTFTFITLPRDDMRKLTGVYDFGRAGKGAVFLHDGRLFIDVPGQGEAEMFARGPTWFTLRVVGGVDIRFELDGAGRVSGVLLRLGDLTMRGVYAGREN